MCGLCVCGCYVDVVFCVFFFFLMIRRPPRSTLDRSSAASDVYKRQLEDRAGDPDLVHGGEAHEDIAHVADGAIAGDQLEVALSQGCLLYTSPSPRDRTRSRMPSSA